jgi:hypothetical protein
MDIHKPKAAHSWREFLVEIGTIICGILIALGLEQVIERVHEGTLRQEAREAIRGEIGRNLTIFQRRDAIQSCIDDRLKALEGLLVSTTLGEPLPRPLWVGRPQVWPVSESRWSAQASGGRTALLAADEQARYGEVYASFHELDDAERIEQLAWAHLRELETLPTLDAQTRARLIEALHEARYANFRIKIAGAQARDRARAAGAPGPSGSSEDGSRSVCVAMNTPREAAMRQTIKGKTAIAEP